MVNSVPRLLNSDLHSQFEAMVGTAGVVADPDAMGRFSLDWSGDNRGQPIFVVRPASIEQVQAVVRHCKKLDLAIVPQGGNTGLVGGAIAGDLDRHVVISLERLNTIRTLSEADFTITVDAGCTLQSVKDASETCNLTFPLAIGAQGTSQIGGNAATNAGGVNVLRYGMMRDLVLGLEVVLPNGTLWSSMFGLRKDNRGYDLKQIFIGSDGTLGIITGLMLKLFPKPTKIETAYLGVNSFDDAMSLFFLARHACSDLMTGFEVIGSECIDQARIVYPDLVIPLEKDASVHILMEVSGGGEIDIRSMVENFISNALENGLVTGAVLAENTRQARSFWSIREGLVEGQARRGYHVRTDLSVTLSKVSALVKNCRRAVETNFPHWITQAYGHAGDGNIHFNVLPPFDIFDTDSRKIGKDIQAMLFDVVSDLGGSISAEHGIGRSKIAAFMNGLSPTHVDIIRNIKKALDPSGIMNPGCLISEG